MNNPFEVLGLHGSADADEVRAAYRALVKKCHPDQFLDAEEQRAAQEKLLALNLAYEEALKLAAPKRTSGGYSHTLPSADAKHLAEKMLRQNNPESALRQLLRAESRDDGWYYVQGNILMAMGQYESAHSSYREAVKRDPENNVYRQGALDAALAMKQSNTLQGKLKKLFHRK